MSSQEIPFGIGQLKALLVGINQYMDSNNLSYCVQDAISLQRILSDNKHGMNEENNIRLMIDDSDVYNKPTRNNILNNLRSLSKNAQSDDIILFFFAGHGMEIQGEGFILPSDFRQEAGAQGSISIKSIKDELMTSKAKFKLIFFDACHSGSINGRAETGKMTEDFYKSLFPAPEGFVILSSCKEQEYSYEYPEKEHGVFTFFVLSGLEGDADENSDGYVDVLELHHHITPKVQQWAFQNDKVQTPVIDANFSGTLMLTKAVSEIQKVFKPAKILKKEAIAKKSVRSKYEEAIDFVCNKEQKEIRQMIKDIEYNRLHELFERILDGIALSDSGYMPLNSKLFFFIENAILERNEDEGIGLMKILLDWYFSTSTQVQRFNILKVFVKLTRIRVFKKFIRDTRRINSFVHDLALSQSYDSAGLSAEILFNLQSFLSLENVKDMLDYTETNDQVGCSGNAHRYLEKIFKLTNGLDKEKLNKYRKGWN